MDSLALETGKYKYLTPAQVTFFMVHGFVRLTDCFSPEKAAEWTSNIWARLGMDPNDKSTWTLPRIHMPSHRNEPVSTFAPKAWGAICELLGGEERIATEAAVWKDSFIVNLGSEEWEGKDVSPKDLDNWHCDGDFFMHYLDSREQALLVIPCFSNIVPGGGGTVISPDGIEVIAKHLVSIFLCSYPTSCLKTYLLSESTSILMVYFLLWRPADKLASLGIGTRSSITALFQILKNFMR